jgi:tRNA(Arg) A34 adenosine deaminase TadA
MRQALAQAELGDAPFGAVLVQHGVVVASACNTGKADRTPLAHAEINLIRTAIAELGTANLEGCTLYATAEPCPMCMGAIIWARVSRLIYGVSTEQLRGLVPIIGISCREIAARSPYRIEVISGILEDECLEVFRK